MQNQKLPTKSHRALEDSLIGPDFLSHLKSSIQ